MEFNGLNIKIGSIFSWGRQGNKEKHKKANQVIPIAQKFLQIFEEHGVKRNQIPEFFGHGLSYKDVLDDEILTEKLSPEMVREACELFAINVGWLHGHEENIYPFHDFYKKPEKFKEFLESLLFRAEKNSINAYVLLSEQKKTGVLNDVLLVLCEPIGFVDNEIIYRTHICSNWIYTYWKSRGYLLACFGIAWQSDIHFELQERPLNDIQKYASRACFLRDYTLHRIVSGYLDDQLLNPDAFLEDIDAELDNFGKKAALEIWLDLFDQGYLNVDFNFKQTREKFVAALNSYL